MKKVATLVIFLSIVGSLMAGAAQGPSKGILVLEGGSYPVVPEVAKRFAELAGGPNAHIVVVPTALPENLLTPDAIQKFSADFKKFFGVEDIVMLHTRDRTRADSEKFVTPLRNATGVWLNGGQPGQLVEAYAGTRTQREFEALLQRGGVIGGSSAGAIVMGTLMLFGSPGGRGFGFITGTAVGAHVIQRGNEDKLVSVAAEYPGVLVLGPDVGAALVVKGDKAEVIGRSMVLIVDGKEHDGEPYLTLVPGDRYDLKTRVATLLPPEARRAAATAPGMLRRGPAVSKELEGDWEAASQSPERTIHYVLHLKNQADGTVLARLDTLEVNAHMTLGDVRQRGTQLELFPWGATADPATGDPAPVFKGALNQDGSEITGDLMLIRGPFPRERATTKLTFKKVVTTSAVAR